MCGMFKRMKALREIAESVGVEVVKVEQSRGVHFKVTLKKGARVRTSFAAASTSDHRSLMNWKRDIRRMFAE